MRRLGAELFHLVLGLIVTASLFHLFAWAYPIGADTIRAVGWGAMAAVVLMAAGPLRRARQADRVA